MFKLHVQILTSTVQLMMPTTTTFRKALTDLNVSTTKGLNKIYYDPADPGSFGGVDSLYRRARELGVGGISRKVVRDYLTGQDAYTLHKGCRRTYKRNRILVGYIDQQWQADLADLNEIKQYNDGSRYLLTVIDCLSKYAWVAPIRTKGSRAVADAWEMILKESAPRKPQKVQTDKGTEFFNNDVLQLFKKNKIHLFASESDQKAAMVERFNRTLKTKMWRYFSSKNTYRYLDILPKLVTSYNNSRHRTIGMAPSQVTKAKELEIWKRLAGDEITKGSSSVPQKFEVGDQVRMAKWKGSFEKGYAPNWTEEFFKVTEAQPAGRRVYKVQDFASDPVSGVFYEAELQKIAPKGPEAKYFIEKVVRHRGNQALVKWKGWPDKFNSWVTREQVKEYLHGSDG